MFNFLKKKLKNAVSSFSNKAKKELEVEEEKKKEVLMEEPVEVEESVKKEKKQKPVKEKKVLKEKKHLVEETEDSKDKEVVKEEKPKVKKSFFKKIKDSVTQSSLSEVKFDELFWDLEVVLLENNIAFEVIEKIKNDLKIQLVDHKISRSEMKNKILETLASSIKELFSQEKINLLDNIKNKKPYIILFVGVNGSGKTTTLAKLTNYFQDNGLTTVLAAGDTFRAAAIEQLDLHAKNLDSKIIKHAHGSDPAAVAFDAIKHAEATNKDVVLIDTAGRSHSNINLMDELKKVYKVANPDLAIFVGDSLTGNDVVEQAKSFSEVVDFNAIILSKADVDEKGGAAVSVSYVTGKPILFLGVGQDYKDLKEFDKDSIIDSLEL